MSKGALVIGGDIQGVQTALDLADCGIKVTLVEQAPCLQYQNHETPSQSKSVNGTESLRIMPKLLKAADHPNINILTNTTIGQVIGNEGDFHVTMIQQPRYINTDICTSCGRCELECPASIMVSANNTPNGHKAIHRPDYGLKSVPSTYIIEKSGVSPCTATCPAGINVQGYVSLISKGKFDEALDIITETVAFPRVLGRVCTHPCEESCTRSKVDQAVSICALKRFAADNGSPRSSLKRTQASVNNLETTNHPRVAIIGAGPAGLTSARDLARFGHHSTVFEALPVPGGMISVGMPRFRLPREVRQADIEDIIRLGIEIRTSTPIGKDFTLDELYRQGYEAILIAIGAHKNQRLGILGEGLSGVINSIAFLQAFNLKQPVTVGKKVVVIGSGYTGIDSARTAVRLHCERVLAVDRCSRDELQANPEEVAEAEEEGVEFDYLVAPIRIVGDNGRVAGVEFRYIRQGRPDWSGHRHTTPIPGSEFFIEADTVVVAAGQRPDMSLLGGDTTLTEGGKYIVVDPLTMATKVSGIFAAGDATRPSAPVINAIADGHRAAVSIDRFLRGENLEESRSLDKVVPVDVNLDGLEIPLIERQPMPCLLHEYRVGNFEEVDLGFTAEMAVKEAKRCLSCAGCGECLECERACELEAIEHDAIQQEIEIEVGAIAVSGKLDNQQSIKVGDTEGINIIDGHPGIYLIPTSPEAPLSSASAVASKIMIDLTKYSQTVKEHHQVIKEVNKIDVPQPINNRVMKQRALTNAESRVGIFVCGCGKSISEIIDVPNVIKYCQKLDGTVLSQQVEYACIDEGTEEIKDLASQYNLTHVVLAACSCCNLGQICFSCSDRRVQCKSNLIDSNHQDKICYEFVNIREHCAWVHYRNPEAATAKAKSLIKAGLARVRESQPLVRRQQNVEKSVLVISEGLSGMQAATDLAVQGLPTILIRHNRQSDMSTPASNNFSGSFHAAFNQLEEKLCNSGAKIFDKTKLINVEGVVGKYQISVSENGKTRRFTVGAIIIDMSTRSDVQMVNPVASEVEFPAFLLQAVNDDNVHLNTEQSDFEPAVSRLPGIFLCGIGKGALDVTKALVQGSAAASKASVLLNKGIFDIEPTVVTVDIKKCRGCANCESVCPFGAVMVIESTPGIHNAEVDNALCRSCGVCLAHCPTGAISQNGNNDRQLIASLEAILT
jgi:heterodisulfide reductase subunit A-like polyferredoxin